MAGQGDQSGDDMYRILLGVFLLALGFVIAGAICAVLLD
jgi:hypothetical protein